MNNFNINNMLWIEKYRPNNFDDIIGNKDIIQQFKNMIKMDLLRNIIITGNVGIGKTTTINCLCNKYLMNPKENLLEINTSIDRNYGDIRQLLDDFIKKRSDEKKIIILEEVDNLPEATQYAITSMMNKKNVIFFLTCNSIDKLISGLLSKCLLLNFSKLTNDNIKDGITNILKKECIEYEEDALMDVVIYSNHDMRFAINQVQAISQGYGKITKKTINCIISKSLSTLLHEYIDLCLEKKTKQSLDYITKIIDKGYSDTDIFLCLFAILRKDQFNGNENQLRFLNIIGKYHVNLLLGCKNYIQLYALTYELCLPS